MRIRSTSSPLPRLGLTALIDVVFILVVFFMLATRFEEWGHVPVAAAQAGASAVSMEGFLVLGFGPEGVVHLGGQKTSRDTMLVRAANIDTAILLRPLSGASAQDAVDLLDTLKTAGISAPVAFLAY